MRVFLTHLFSGTTGYEKHYKVFYLRVISHPTRTQASRCGNTFAFATANLYTTIQCNCSACRLQRAPDAGLQKRADFFTLIEG
jgi:hypothetical protein